MQWDLVYVDILIHVYYFFLEFQEKRDRGTQTAKDPMTLETEKLAFDIVFFAMGKRNANSGRHLLKIFKRELSNKHD